MRCVSLTHISLRHSVNSAKPLWRGRTWAAGGRQGPCPSTAALAEFNTTALTNVVRFIANDPYYSPAALLADKTASTSATDVPTYIRKSDAMDLTKTGPPAWYDAVQHAAERTKLVSYSLVEKNGSAT